MTDRRQNYEKVKLDKVLNHIRTYFNRYNYQPDG